MKILRIGLSNLNSLRGEHEVDLEAEPLGNAGIFAITGQTGAGKSTLLDAVTLALYGRAARYGESPNPEDMMSRHTGECHAEVDFEVPRGRFRAVWQLRRARGQADGKLQPGKRYLYDADGQVLAEKIGDVGRLVEELSGLDYNRFTRSVLLAQGEFAKFLKAKPDERAELLESLTRTGIYSDLGVLLHGELGRREGEVKDAERILGEIVVLDEKERAKKEAECKKSQDEWELLKRKRSKLAEQISSGKQLRETITKKASLEQEQEEIRKKVKAANDDFARLKGYREAQPFLPSLAQVEQAEELSQAKRASLAKAKEAGEERLAEWRVKLLGAAGTNDHLLGESLPELKLQFANLERSRRELNELEEKVGVLKVPGNYEDAKGAFEKLLENGDEAKRQEELDTLRERLGYFTNLQMQAKSRDQQATRLRQTQDRLKKVAEEEAGVKEKQEKQKASVEESEELLQSQLGLLKAAEKVASFEEHRAHLVDGKECPLCGALEHPFCDGNEVDSVIADLEEKIGEMERKLNVAKSQTQGFQLQLAKLGIEKEQLEKTEKEVDASHKEVVCLMEKLATAANLESMERSAITDGFIACEAQFEAASKGLQDFKEAQSALRWLECEGSIAKASSTLREILGKFDMEVPEAEMEMDCWEKLRARQTAFSSYQESQRQVAEQDEAAKESKKALDERLENLTDRLKESAFENLEALRRARLSSEDEARIAALKAQLDESVGRLKGNLEVVDGELARLRKLESPEGEVLETLQKEAEVLDTRFDTLSETLANLRDLLKRDLENKKKVRQKSDKIETQRKQLRTWRMLHGLIGDSRGKKFRLFAQGISLDLLIRHANKHLTNLTERYQLSRCEEEELELEIVDRFQAGVRRPMSSLSGGESFLASLALALGLSDLAGRNVRIDSLFIDEGFGSLDSDSLEVALSALEGLRQKNKAVGVISHVELLKERVSTQINVEKQPDGTSLLVLR